MGLSKFRNAYTGTRAAMSHFDKYASSYTSQISNATAFVGQGAEFYTGVKARILSKLISKLHLNASSPTLDVGCGIGLTDELICAEFSALEGVDVSEESIKIARMRNPKVLYKTYDGVRLPYSDNTFDFCFAINVLHHVPVDKRQDFLAEMRRVTSTNGYIAIFEHNPLNPLTRKAVRDCPFDEGVVLISPKSLASTLEKIQMKTHLFNYILFFPFKGAFFRMLEDLMHWCPLGAQFVMVAKK